MDWYPKKPQKYRNDTWGLTLAEHGAYNLLLDHYYISESPLPADDRALASICGCSLEEWLVVKENVTRHFRVSNMHLTHQTCDEVIEKFLISKKKIEARNNFRLMMTSGEWSVLRKSVFERDGYRCVYCGKSGRLECDHIIPVSRGGESNLFNLATACFSCNRSKGSRLLEEWNGANG